MTSADIQRFRDNLNDEVYLKCAVETMAQHIMNGKPLYRKPKGEVKMKKETRGIYTKDEYGVTCENCQAHYEGDYANNWIDDWNYCPNCGSKINKE